MSGVFGLRICLLVLATVICSAAVNKSARYFTIDYSDNTFVKDDQPFRYVSGSLHYFRVPHQFWRDRMIKMRAAGLNALETYVEWSSHEPEPNQYNFRGDLDLIKFIKTAQKVGFVVILRIGPYIDAERDMGGLPYWLLRMKKNMVLRSSDSTYIKYVDRWLKKLLPLIKPTLYSNGGPIVMIQVENEYGSYFACDQKYTNHLRDMYIKHLGKEILLFTTDGAATSLLKCGVIDGVYATVDFGPGTNVTAAFAVQRTREPKGPLVNSEYYPGWLDHWGYPHSQVSTDAVAKTLDKMLAMNASVNIYVFHGGTSFGFTSGSNQGDNFQACPTSYDYDAPLTEAGDPTEKYFAIRKVVQKYLPLPPIPLPTPSPKMKLSHIYLNPVQSLLDYLSTHSNNKVVSQYPLTFEELHQAHGFVLYQTTVTFRPRDPVLLSVPGIRDRGYVFVNNKLQGILSRGEKITELPVFAAVGQTISLLVENQGRICVTKEIHDFKGIKGNVTLGGKVLTNWTMVPVKLDKAVKYVIEKLPNLRYEQTIVPGFYGGLFVLSDSEKLYDTFLRLDGWYKGVAFINGHNLGRYWPIVGPQQTLYVPSVYLKRSPEVNTIVLLELENAPCILKGNTCSVEFTDIPVINGPTPYEMKKKKAGVNHR